MAITRVLWGVVGSLWLATSVDAATYYVAKAAQGGNNNNTCTQAQSIATPKLTIVAGAACLTAPGDVLLIRAGTYDERLVNIVSGTSWSAKIRVANYNGEEVWISPTTGNEGAVPLADGRQYIEFDGINYRTSAGSGIIGAAGSVHHIRYMNGKVEAAGCCPGTSGSIYTSTDGNEFINLEVYGIGGPYGMYIDGGVGALVDGLDIHDVSMGGIHAFSDDRTPPSNVIIRNTKIHDITFSHRTTQAFGILFSGTNLTAVNNVIYGLNLPVSPADVNGIVVYTGSGNKVYHNTIVNNDGGAIKVDSFASNTEVRNNLSFGNTGSHLTNLGTNTFPTPATSYNLFGITPDFVDGGNDNYHLLATSDAIDAAACLSTVTTDHDGIFRPQGTGATPCDHGAYEFSSGSPAPPTVTITGPTTNDTYLTSATSLGGDTEVTWVATDDIGIASCSCVHDRGVACVAHGTATGNIELLEVLEGSNAITVTCVDTSGLSASDTLTVIVTPDRYRLPQHFRRSTADD